MHHYLLKSYDARGRLVDRFEFSAPNDLEAEAAVLDLESERTQELWRGSRWLRTWPAAGLRVVRAARPSRVHVGVANRP